MTAEDDRQRDLAAIRRRLGSTTEGIVVAQDWDNGFVTVDVGGTLQEIRTGGGMPWPGDRVRVVSSDGAAFCVPVWGASIGTVQSVSSGRATVLADDGVLYTYPYVGAVPGTSDRVALSHAARQVLGAISAEPADSEYTQPPPPPTPSVMKRTFSPSWSGNWIDGVYKGPLAEVSVTRAAAYGYGTQIRDTIPDSADIIKAVLYLSENWDNVDGTASSMGTHSYGSRPATFSNSNLSGSYSVPGLTVNIIGTVANALKTGSAFGVGFRSGSSGWRQYKAAPASGRIYIEWAP